MTDFAVERDDSGFVQQRVILDHYLHRWPVPLSLPFGYRLLCQGRATAPDGRA